MATWFDALISPDHAESAATRNEATPHVIDFRFTPQDHRCSGVWQYIGLNAGSHELYKCDGGHYGIGLFVNPALGRVRHPDNHDCGDSCTLTVVVNKRQD